MKTILLYMVGAMLLMVFVLLMLTPEKDKNGNYTQPFKYWTDDVYYNQNFRN